jgi:two-component system KDP operon response regulator KdpE
MDSVAIDFEKRTVSKKGKIVNLTPTEFSILSLLVHNAGKLITHDSILRQIRGPWFEKDTAYSRVYMGRLRKKLEDDPDHPQMFQTEPGRGYKFVAK